MDYYLTELHAHTRHSDGDFTTLELLKHAEAFGYDVLAITDHNTMAPLDEVSKVSSEDLLILSGMEWTTFFGHVLVIGANQVVDWRQSTIDTIDSALKEVKSFGGITGIAHPFSIGSPICTGCHWDYHVENYNLIDFIEIWNRLRPDENFRSQQAYEMWVDLLNQGYRLSCSAGRDWHRLEKTEDNTALTYVGATELSSKEIIKNLTLGNFYISLGPRMACYIRQEERYFVMGQELATGKALLELTALETEQKKLKKFGFEVRKLIVWLNKEVVYEIEIVKNQKINLPLNLLPGYLRLELWGIGKGQKEKRLVISNPFYIISDTTTF